MYSTILHASDLSNNHFNLCQQAKRLADCFKAKFYLLHVIELPSSVQLAQGLGFIELAKPLKNDAQTVLQTLGEALEIPLEQQLVAIGSVHRQIISQARELNCDLIVIGSHSHHGLANFLGSSAYAVMHQASCSVLTLKTSV